MVHPGKLGQRLSSKVVGSTLAAGALSGTAVAVGVAAATGGVAAGLIVPVFLLPGLGILGHRTINKKKWKLAKRLGVFSRIYDKKWTCCNQRDNPGCTEVCDNESCRKPWGRGPGCVWIMHPDGEDINKEYMFFPKSHNLLTNEN